MIKANHTFGGRIFFNLYSGIKLKKQFREIRFIDDLEDAGLPVLIIANHFSWWDGFIQLQLNKRFFKRSFHVMMLEEQLNKFMLLNKGGAFSVQKNSRDIIESLNYSLDLLSDPKNVVLLFPQGEIQSLYTTDFRFETGLNYLLKNLKTEIQLVFNVNLVDYFSNQKPELRLYYKTYPLRPDSSLKSIESDFNLFAKECKLQQKEK